jgi:S1-C subfamily serine protease
MSDRDTFQRRTSVDISALAGAEPTGAAAVALASSGRPWRRVPVIAATLVILSLIVALVLTNLRISSRPDLTSRAVNAISDTQANAAVSKLESAPPTAATVYGQVRAGLVVIEADSAHGARDLGSGFLVTSSGEIMTALHVVTSASSIKVIFADGTISAASISSADASNDTAVLTQSSFPRCLVATRRLVTPSSRSVTRSDSSVRFLRAWCPA